MKQPLPLDVRLMNQTAMLMAVVFVLLVLFSGGRWFAQQPLFAIRGLTVLGDVNHQSVPVLRTQVVPRISGTFLTVDLHDVRQTFEDLPWVRRAVVQREFPNRLRVILQEHHAAAFWGEDGASTMVNSYGELFEANPGEVESDRLPRFDGPRTQSAQVLAMQHLLAPLFAAQGLVIERLVLSERGLWRSVLATSDAHSESTPTGGALIELGSGTATEIAARVRQFLDTVGPVAAYHGRSLDAIEGADLRYPQGYALRLRGVSTVMERAPAAEVRRPAAKPQTQRRR